LKRKSQRAGMRKAVAGSFLEAAAAVLRAAKQPLSVVEIITEIHKRGLLTTRGRTPSNTMSAALYREVTRNPASRFVRLSEEGPHRARQGSVRWKLKAE